MEVTDSPDRTRRYFSVEHPAVQEVAIVRVRNEPVRGKPVAFIVLREGFLPSGFLEGEMRELITARIAGHKCPRKVMFVELPRTASGKVQRCKLRDFVESGA